MSRIRRPRPWFWLLSGVALALAALGVFARKLAERLLSPRGLAPPPEGREDLVLALSAVAPIVSEFLHPGSSQHPVTCSALFASPGDPASRPTLLFLHGKGGSIVEWQPDALRALAAGYNVLLPDLRGHPPSQGGFVTYGLLEKDDLANALSAAQERFGLDRARLGVHACSAGCSVALELAGRERGIRAIWLESPYAEPREMARHYLSVATGIPPVLLGLLTRWAVHRAVERIQRELGVSSRRGVDTVDPLQAVSRVRTPVALVYGSTDALVPPRFVERLAASLPAGSEVWKARAGHCHHEDEPQRLWKKEYERRWSRFFQRHLPSGGREATPGHGATSRGPSTGLDSSPATLLRRGARRRAPAPPRPIPPAVAPRRPRKS